MMKKRYPEPAFRSLLALQILLLACFSSSSQGVDTFRSVNEVRLEKAPVFFLDFYQRHLSHLRGSHCPMYPSCSEYARIVIGRYSSLMAYPLICDRLLRCGHDFTTYADTIIQQQRRWIDIPYSFTETFVDEWNTKKRTDTGAAEENVADFLYRNGFYEQAYLEYLRCLSHERDSATILKAAYAAYHAYDYQRFTHEIVSLLHLLSKEQKNLSGELYLLIAKRGYAAGLYPTTYTVLEKYRPYFKTPVLHEEYRLLSTVTALYCDIDSVSKLTKNDFFTGSPLSSYHGRIDSLYLSLDRLRPRSAAAAGFLSTIIPGAGYMIGDRKRTALFSLLFNGLLAWSTVEFVRQENYGAATFSTLLGSGFYIGSIVGSIRAVSSYNQNKRKSLIKSALYDLDVAP